MPRSPNYVSKGLGSCCHVSISSFEPRRVSLATVLSPSPINLLGFSKPSVTDGRSHCSSTPTTATSRVCLCNYGSNFVRERLGSAHASSRHQRAGVERRQSFSEPQLFLPLARHSQGTTTNSVAKRACSHRVFTSGTACCF